MSTKRISAEQRVAAIDEDTITIKITPNYDVLLIQMKVKYSRFSLMKTLMGTYCCVVGYPVDALRFVYKGRILRENDTPASLKMPHGEVEIRLEKINDSDR